MATEHLTKATFTEKVFNFEQNKDWKFEGKLPCIIDFYADWCGPCKMVAPILEELSTEYAGKVNIYKIDTEAEQELAGVSASGVSHPCCFARLTASLRCQSERFPRILLSRPSMTFF